MTTHRRSRALLLGVVTAVVAAIIAGGVLTVFAQTNSSGADRKEAYLESLAARLGVTVDALKQAIKDTNLEQLDQLVQEGLITEEQADVLRERIQNAETPWFGVPRGFGRHGVVPRLCGLGGEELATFLGIDVATLRSELRSGKSLAQIAEEHGKTREELKTFLTEQLRTKLDQAVADGRLTEEEADAKLQRFTERLDSLIDATFPPKPFGGRHHRWGDDDGDSGSDGASTSTTTAFRW